jgi:hypothetical protein
MAKKNGNKIEHEFEAPQFDRLNYFYGQMLGVNDFQAEQSYFREKIKLHNRCLHGYGTVCGLRVLVPEPEPGCTTHPDHPWVYIEPGLALDASGIELIVREGESCLKIDLWEALSAEDQQTVKKQLGDDKDAWYCEPLYVCLHHRDCPLGPSQPITVDPCGGTLPMNYGKLRDGVRVSVSLTAPDEDTRCDTCCCCAGPCECVCLLLARIDRFHPHKPVNPEYVRNDVRRRIGTYAFTTITGVNWRHGSEHRREYVRRLLYEGLVVHFSRPVLVDTLRRGVIDLYHIESRSTRHPNIIELRGEIAECHGKTTDELRYRVPHLDECPEPGDRVLVVVRSGFILDECCRPVDGLNVGGRVPYRPDEKLAHESPGPVDPCLECQDPPWGYAPWVSGNGTGGGTFESWFYVEDRKEAPHGH